MILSDIAILEARERETIVIEPFDQRHLGTNSYDCTLAPTYYMPKVAEQIIDLAHPETVRDMYMQCEAERDSKDGIHKVAILPGTTILAHTNETIGSTAFLMKMYSRSTIGRSGLAVCKCAGLGDLGYINKWTMEISNLTKNVILIPVGFRVCQFTFEEVTPTSKQYAGTYGEQWMPERMLPKAVPDWAVVEHQHV